MSTGFVQALMKIATKIKECKMNSNYKFVITDEFGADHDIQAQNLEEAILKYAKESNEENGYYLLDEKAEVTVGGKKFWISVVSDIQYWIKEVK